MFQLNDALYATPVIPMFEQLPESWIRDYADKMYQWALRKTTSHDAASDLVQDTFLAAAEKIGTFKGESAPKTWLYAILNNKIKDYYRASVQQATRLGTRVYGQFFDSGGDWERDQAPGSWDEEHGEWLDDITFRNILQHCIDQLPESMGIAVRLKYLVEKKGDEICQEMDITPSNYWQIIHRAKLQLRVCIEQKWLS